MVAERKLTRRKTALAPGSTAWAALANLAESHRFGTVEGIVTYHGAVPRSSRADDVGVHRDLMQVDRETRGLQHLVVYLGLESKPPDQKEESTPTRTDSPPKPVVVDQQNNTFLPHEVAFCAGQAVTSTNSDLGNHNVRSASRNPKNE